MSIDRREADKQLMLPGNPRGTFLIRNSQGVAFFRNEKLSIVHVFLPRLRVINFLKYLKLYILLVYFLLSQIGVFAHVFITVS